MHLFSFIFDLSHRTPLLPSPSRTREGRMEILCHNRFSPFYFGVHLPISKLTLSIEENGIFNPAWAKSPYKKCRRISGDTFPHPAPRTPHPDISKIETKAASRGEANPRKPHLTQAPVNAKCLKHTDTHDPRRYRRIHRPLLSSLFHRRFPLFQAAAVFLPLRWFLLRG